MAGEVMVRLWQGQTEAGSEVVALVAAIGTHDQIAVEGLLSISPPDEASARAWATEILDPSISSRSQTATQP